MHHCNGILESIEIIDVPTCQNVVVGKDRDGDNWHLRSTAPVVANHTAVAAAASWIVRRRLESFSCRSPSTIRTTPCGRNDDLM